MKLVGQIETAPPADNVVALEQAPSKRKARGSSWVAGLKAAACLAVVFLSTLFYLGYTDPELSAIPQPATQNVHRVSVGSLIRGHALLQTSNPFADHSAWQYVASESDLATAPRAPESESANSVDMMVQEDIR